MRVISGSAHSIILKVAGTARPYLEKTRGAIFNSLCAEVPEASVLDLYAGSGSVGIEALSRGASRCVFVEADRVSVATIQENLKKCRLEERADVRLQRAAAYVQSSRECFDLIFVDPPFAENPGWPQEPEARALMEGAGRVLAPDGLLIFRFEHLRLQPPSWKGLELVKDRRYGRSRVLVYARPGAEVSGSVQTPEQD